MAKSDAELAEMPIEIRNDYLDDRYDEARDFAEFQDREIYNQDIDIDEDARMDAYERQFGWV